MAKIGPPDEVVALLIGALKDDEQKVRESAASALGDLAPAVAKTAVPALLAAVLEGGNRDAASALIAVGRADERVISIVVAALDDENTEVPSRSLIGVLEEIGPDDALAWRSLARALGRLWNNLTSGDERRAIVQALAAMGPDPKDVVPVFLEVSDADEYLWADVIEVLKDIGPTAVPEVLRGLTDGKPAIRCSAIRILGGLGAPAPVAVPALSDSLGDMDAGVRLAAATALSEMGPSAIEAVPALAAAVTNDNALRAMALAAAGALGPVAQGVAWPALFDLLRDESDVARSMAAMALGRMGPAAKEAVPALVAALKDPCVAGDAWEALKQIDPQAALREALR